MNDTDDNYERIIARLTNAPTIHLPARAHLDPRMTPALMRVFTSMCWHLNEDWVCWPGQDLLASELHITQQAVSKSIRQLLALGYVEIVRRGYRGFGQTNVYRVIFQPNAENLAEKYSGNPRKSENADKSSDTPSPINPHTQPEVVSIHNLRLSHTQPEVVQKYTNEVDQRRSSSEDSFSSTSLARGAENRPPTVMAPPERRTRERFDSSALRRDPLYIALAEHLPEPQTYDEWRTWAAMIGRLHRIQVSAADIPTAVKGYGLLYPNAVMTIRALVNQWAHIREGKTREQVAASIRNRNTAQAERAAQQRRSEQRGEYLQLVRDTLGLGPDDPLPPEFDDYARD